MTATIDLHRPKRNPADPLAMEFARRPCRATLVRAALSGQADGAASRQCSDVHARWGMDESAAVRSSHDFMKPGLDPTARVLELWDTRLSAVEVETPDAALNMLTNRWLLYQTLSCRVHARSAFYQSGGAFGFRDQLQDVLAFLHFDPDIARGHIVRAAGRQFAEGDAQHWWHEPGGEGVRTRIQDDRLWLVYAAMEYARVTGKHDIFDATAPILEQRAPGPDEESVYETPTVIPGRVHLRHCARAIARTMGDGRSRHAVGRVRRLNDGMDACGCGGRGESVWLGWFAASLLDPFATICEARGDAQQAATYRAMPRG